MGVGRYGNSIGHGSNQWEWFSHGDRSGCFDEFNRDDHDDTGGVGYWHGNGHGDLSGDSNKHAYTHANSNSYINTDSNQYAYRNPHSDAHQYSHRNFHSDSN